MNFHISVTISPTPAVVAASSIQGGQVLPTNNVPSLLPTGLVLPFQVMDPRQSSCILEAKSGKNGNILLKFSTKILSNAVRGALQEMVQPPNQQFQG